MGIAMLLESIASAMPERPLVGARADALSAGDLLELAGGGATVLRDAGAEMGPERLPLDGQHPMALQIAKRAVVRDDLKPVAQGLEAAPRAMATVGALADQVGEHRCLGV